MPKLRALRVAQRIRLDKRRTLRLAAIASVHVWRGFCVFCRVGSGAARPNFLRAASSFPGGRCVRAVSTLALTLTCHIPLAYAGEPRAKPSQQSGSVSRSASGGKSNRNGKRNASRPDEPSNAGPISNHGDSDDSIDDTSGALLIVGAIAVSAGLTALTIGIYSGTQSNPSDQTSMTLRLRDHASLQATPQTAPLGQKDRSEPIALYVGGGASVAVGILLCYLGLAENSVNKHATDTTVTEDSKSRHSVTVVGQATGGALSFQTRF